MKFIWRFFDKLEDHVRVSLSHYPLLYSLIGGAGVVLFWRGIWHTADTLENGSRLGSIVFSGVGSIIVGITILLVTGLFVATFIGDSIIISGIKKDKKLIEKSTKEIEEDLKIEDTEKNILQKIEENIEEIKEKI
jgi:hypothetical protein